MKAKKQRSSLQDIADRVGVTRMTVSRYLKSPSLVSQTTGEKIQQEIDRVGYVASKAPGILSNATSKAIGILIPSISNQVFSAVVQGIEQVTGKAGYQTLIAHYGYDKRIEEQRIESMLSYNVDGLILSESDHTDKSLNMIKHSGIPVVEMMDSSLSPIDLSVGLNHQEASEAILNRMIEKGKRHLAFFGARMDLRVQQRQAAYEKVMMEQGLEPRILITEAPSSYTLGSSLMSKALTRYSELDAVFCCNDDLGVGAILECQRRHISIPGQVAIAGFNALDIGRAISPSLASVVTPRSDIGKTAASMLLDKLAGNEPEQTVIDLGYSLFEGESI